MRDQIFTGRPFDAVAAIDEAMEAVERRRAVFEAIGAPLCPFVEDLELRRELARAGIIPTALEMEIARRTPRPVRWRHGRI